MPPRTPRKPKIVPMSGRLPRAGAQEAKPSPSHGAEVSRPIRLPRSHAEQTRRPGGER